MNFRFRDFGMYILFVETSHNYRKIYEDLVLIRQSSFLRSINASEFSTPFLHFPPLKDLNTTISSSHFSPVEIGADRRF